MRRRVTPESDMSVLRRTAPWIFLVSVLLSGCSRLSTEYGKSKGTSGYRSINGFGALRTSYENAGFRNRDVSRLSDRVMRTDVIVWTPRVLGSVSPKVTRWFERWLARGNKTLVYIIPDSGSEADYWTEAAKLASPEQRLEYRKRSAKSINERMKWRMNRGQIVSNGWFRVEPLLQSEPLDDLSGPWVGDLDQPSPDLGQPRVEFNVAAFDEDLNSATVKANAATGFVVNGPTGPGAPQWRMPTTTEQTRTRVEFRSLGESSGGNTFVSEVVSKPWKDSKVVVVSGGSLLTNYAFTRPFNRRLAAKIVAASTPPEDQDLRAGFLTSDWNQIPVSEAKVGAPVATGMELLTVWPMSLVTMHGVMFGLVICLMLLPIFGRPKRIRRTKQSDFGDHLDAVAALMNKAGGERYARARISEYMKRMHGETTGTWVLPDPPALSTTPAAKPLGSNRLARPAKSETLAADSGSAVENESETTPRAGDPIDHVDRQHKDTESDTENQEADR